MKWVGTIMTLVGALMLGISAIANHDVVAAILAGSVLIAGAVLVPRQGECG